MNLSSNVYYVCYIYSNIKKNFRNLAIFNRCTIVTPSSITKLKCYRIFAIVSFVKINSQCTTSIRSIIGIDTLQLIKKIIPESISIIMLTYFQRCTSSIISILRYLDRILKHNFECRIRSI